jgi:GT2 family glycosyltransferase
MKTVTDAPLVYVIVLNHNGSEHLPYCLPSICATEYSHLQVLVVDNASTDGSLALASNFPVRTLTSDRNLGWSGGNNLGIREALAAGARYVVLANSDIRVHPRWIDEAVAVAESSPDVGVIGFDVHEPGPGDHDRDAGYSDAYAQWAPPTATSSPEYVGGMAMFVRCAAFEHLGLIDENFFAYGEENDFQIRARGAGYRILSINVPVWHYGQAGFGKHPYRASLLQTENNIQLLLKHRGPMELLRAGGGHIYRRFLRRNSAPPSSAVELRLRGGSKIRMASILLLAVGRVILKAPAILRRRVADRRLVEAHRQGSRAE